MTTLIAPLMPTPAQRKFLEAIAAAGYREGDIVPLTRFQSIMQRTHGTLLEYRNALIFKKLWPYKVPRKSMAAKVLSIETKSLNVMNHSNGDDRSERLREEARRLRRWIEHIDGVKLRKSRKDQLDETYICTEKADPSTRNRMDSCGVS